MSHAEGYPIVCPHNYPKLVNKGVISHILISINIYGKLTSYYYMDSDSEDAILYLDLINYYSIYW